MNSKTLMLLLVEDNFDDVFFLRRALRKVDPSIPVRVAENGQEAVDYLRGAGRFGDRDQYPLPSLVLLDLKIPYLSGFDVLKWIREQSKFVGLPVVILTSSPELCDQEMAEELGASGYLVKPPTEDMLRRLLGSVALSQIQLPPADPVAIAGSPLIERTVERPRM